MLSPVLGDAFGQERVVRESTQLLRHAGHAVALVGEVQEGALPENDGYLLVPELATINHLSRSRHAWQSFRPVLHFLEHWKPDIVHLIDQFDYRLMQYVCENYPTVLTAHTVAPTCPASHRMTNRGIACESKSGYRCLWNNLKNGCLDGFRNDIHRLNAIYEFKLKRTALRSLKKIIANSYYLQRTLLKDGWKKHQVATVFNPVTAHASTHPFSVPAEYILSAGRLTPLKGHAHLLLALAQISHPWNLVICGDGTERESLEKLTEELNLKKRVYFLGKTTLTQTHALMRDSLFVCQPNLGPESFGLSAAEASLLGKAVVGYDIPALNEMIVHEQSGLLARCGDIEHLKKCLTELLSNPRRRELFGETGSARMRQYSPEKHLQSTLNVYRETIATPIRARRKFSPLRDGMNQTT